MATGSARVLISNPEVFASKKGTILHGGLRKLQVITDFDKTLTPLRKADGNPAPTSYSILEASGTFSKRYHALAEELYARYHPSEVSLSMPMHQKKEEMVTWWTLANANLIEEHIRHSRIAEQVAASGCVLRPGTQAVMALLAAHNVPTLVFSAGIGDVLAEVLKHEGVPESPNLHYVSNFVDVDKDGFVVGFKPPLIHVFNKNETSLVGTPYFRQVAERPNVILLGDSLGDIGTDFPFR
jgi:5'-nucleotidase